MAEQSISIKDRYFELLMAYVTKPEESYLLEAADLGRELVLAGVSPEDIGEIHEQALDRLARERPDMTLLDAARLISAPLMELLMAYGLAFRERLEERKRAMEALREREARYRAVVEYQTDLICRFLPDGTLTFVNQAYCRYHGKQREELVGHSLMPLILPEDREKAAQHLASFGQATPVATIQYRAVAAGGKVRWQHWINRPVFDEQGGLTEFQSVGRDITERKRAEQERDRLLAQVQEQAGQMQQIMDTAPEGVLLLDAEGRVVLANPVAEGDLAVLAGAKVGDTLTHLGDRPLAELLARPPRGMWHEVATDDRHFEVIARPVEAGPPTGGACPGPALSAAEGPALSAAEGPALSAAEGPVEGVYPGPVLSAAEGPVEGVYPEPVEGWVLVIRDVTQEREVQRRIQQQERLAAVGQLAAGIAHDFNNIMATIVLYAQMMMRTEERPSRDRERLVTIDQQARHAAHLTQQILDFSRRAVLDRRPLDLVPFLKESLKLLERTLPENIELGLAYGRDEYVVNADPMRVQQAVMNLALNARDAMPEGGDLRIGLGRIRIGPDESPPLPEMALRQAQGAEPGEWVRVTVSDTGTGIPPEVLPHVFEPFFTTKPVGQGSGLGLAQVYGIVKQHEGEIGVKSQVGHGTTFTFYLPALPVSAPEPLAQEMEPLAFGHGETILVVEDDPSVRVALSDTLETLNYRVLEAANGRKALEVYRVARSGDRPQQGVDLVLTDLVMPGMGGRELMRELRKMDPRVKGLAVTGYAVSEDLREEGIVEVVEKPFDVDTLAEAVRRALAAF
ncbi:MAG: PAS domain S-box protein [Anaerolineae bacterium]|nr:PAS domain S-box protein [Anaerolineae bacterium]